jgi:hypothetical protein
MMPDWLPDLVVTDGEWSKVVAELYCVFCRDFKDNRPTLNGLPVICDDRASEGGYEERFWHLITQDDPLVLKWVYREKGKLRTYLWVKDLDYVVVLKAVPPTAPRYYFLITAFHLDGPHQRRNIERRYDKREA